MSAGVASTVPNSARALLVEWANQQDAWVRLLVSEVLSTPAAVPDAYLDTVYQSFLVEKTLAKGDPLEVSSLVDSGATKDVIEPLILLQLGELKNVNALAEGQTIDFNSKLTIVFGQNASGKTGYVRVLKMVAAVRTAERILPNVVSQTTTTGGPSASISYRSGEKDEKVAWKNESGLIPFTRIDVFDSSATNLHVDGDLNYIYTPAELARFPRAQKGLESIKSRLEADIAIATKTPNTFTALFARGTKVFAVIESLGASTDLLALRSLATLTTTQQQEIEPLRTEIEALKSNSQELQIRATTDLKQKVEALGKALSTLAGVDMEAYSSGLERMNAASEQYDDVTKQSFAGLPIPGILQDAWKQFIQTGESYLVAAEVTQYPSDGANCVYCQQPLGGPAVELLKKYRDFCNNTFRAELTDAQGAVDAIVAPLRTAINFPDPVPRLVRAGSKVAPRRSRGGRIRHECGRRENPRRCECETVSQGRHTHPSRQCLCQV